MTPRIVLSPTRSAAVAIASVALVVGACGGDDADSSGQGPAPADANPADTNPADTNPADTTPAAGEAPTVTGTPAVGFSDALHPLDLPAPGTAVVTLAGATYTFETLSVCEIRDGLEGRWTFIADGFGEAEDGSRTYFNLSRTVVDPEVLSPSDWHERDYLQIGVEQELGGGMYSNAWHDVNRDTPDDPISGDGDVLPVVYVVDGPGGLAATGIAELRHPPLTGEFDRVGEGRGEFAVNCG